MADLSEDQKQKMRLREEVENVSAVPTRIHVSVSICQTHQVCFIYKRARHWRAFRCSRAHRYRARRALHVVLGRVRVHHGGAADARSTVAELPRCIYCAALPQGTAVLSVLVRGQRLRGVPDCGAEVPRAHTGH
jgi:hypothetical protein